MERTFILHAGGAKLPTDLLGLTCVRYGEATKAAEMKAVNQKLRKAIEDHRRSLPDRGTVVAVFDDRAKHWSLPR